MRRIRAFGCSLTQQHHWKYLVKNFSNDLNGQEEGFTEWKQGNIHLTDYSFSGCGNDIQHIQYANEVYYENILKDDIILWQLSSPDRVAIINETDTDEHYVFNRGPRNVFTGEKINIKSKFSDPPFNLIPIKNKIKNLKKGSLLEWLKKNS